MGEDPEVIRAKYFIRDEFLVSKFSGSLMECHNNRVSILAYIDSQWRWQALLLSALYLCGRYGKHQESFQWLPRHHSENASAAIRAVIGRNQCFEQFDRQPFSGSIVGSSQSDFFSPIKQYFIRGVDESDAVVVPAGQFVAFFMYRTHNTFDPILLYIFLIPDFGYVKWHALVILSFIF